jgi:hypothetical protein
LDATAAQSAIGVFRLLLSAASKVGPGKREVGSLHKLANKKIAEMRKTHALFVRLMRILCKAAEKCADDIRRGKNFDVALTKLSGEIAKVRDLRIESKPKRMEQYSEAKAYQTMSVQDRGILKKIPDELALQLHGGFLRIF